jgi:hypothetical protein
VRLPARDRALGLEQRRGGGVARDPEHDLVAALLGAGGGGGDLGGDQRGDVIDVGRADRNDHLDPVGHCIRPLRRGGLADQRPGA